MNQTAFTPGQAIGGYRIKQVSPLPAINAHLIQLVHEKTKAVHIHIANEDKENTFGVFFRTVPTDSTGVAHILEHTVLCGSEKYKVRDPFFSMLKRSLSTFMNAFTASDWTMYPFSTQNKKDYFNLMDVYLDAAFFPDIDYLSFKQEGHRLELEPGENGEPELVYKGVVYNEMKGAMSSPAQVMSRALLKGLYPDTTYANNSGGEPADIPKLTYEGLKAFHATYYHPSNSYFYTYGDLPLEESLTFIEKKVLSRFDFLEMDTRVPSQPRWQAPKTMTQAYAYSDTDKIAAKYQGCVAWLTPDIADHFEVMVMAVLEQILLGNSASPLRKALIDSGLGSALCDGTGFDADNRDTMFVCGLKDLEASAVPEVEKIINSTLEALVTKGIDKNLIDSAIHQIEFSRKEITNTPYPYGIKLIMGVASIMIHDGDPVSAINIDHDLKKLQEKLAKGPFLEGRIRQYFLDNPHRLLFTLAPDEGIEARQAENVRQELQKLQKSLNDAELAQINEDAAALKVLQDAEENLDVLPTLALEDVPPDIEIIHPDVIKDISCATAFDKPTSGILYFTCPAGAGNIAPDLFPMVPFFARAFTNAGTANSSYVQMAERMDLYTGGISISPFSGTHFDHEGKGHSFIALQGKALDRNIDHLFDMVDEYINACSFKDHDRLKSLILQYQAGLEASIVGSGHRYAITLSARHLSTAAGINELWHGIAQYALIKELTARVNDEKTGAQALAELEKDLSAMADAVMRKNNFKPAVIGSVSSMVQADKHISKIYDNLPNSSSQAFHTPQIKTETLRPYDGWMTNTAVSFVGQSFKAVRISHEDAPALSIIAKLLRSLFLHREIREKGGAYGGFAMYNMEEGIFSFGSYRDPHIKRTLDVYADACDFITQGQFTQTDVKEAILQVCSEIDKPETPAPSAMKAFYRRITKLSDEIRKGFKDALLGMDKQKVMETAGRYFFRDEAAKGISVISSKPLLEQANQELEADGREPLRLHKI
ncbi:insulinase family protein [uncultured Desulfobacter sp.]|uniref:insulinase family protein n=1 Tax=uncultured Desulfobacter sp. TaxID=240139 RepID=UPI0029F5C2BC|nr:insulinase family protein [uncultured Desulfobacter sp.]